MGFPRILAVPAVGKINRTSSFMVVDFQVQKPEGIVLGKIFDFNRGRCHADIVENHSRIVNSPAPPMCAEREYAAYVSMLL